MFFPPTPNAIDEWLSDDLCKSLLAQEKNSVEDALVDAFGQHLLHIGVADNSINRCSINHKIVLKEDLSTAINSDGLCAKPEYLPFIQNSIDAVVLQHGLDFCLSPHKVLKEASRVLVPNGDLIVVGFNPFSLWGLRRLTSFRNKKLPWSANFIRVGRLIDWLTLLDFKVEEINYSGYRLPFNMSKGDSFFSGVDKRFNNADLPFGAVYTIKAKKQYAGMLPTKPSWRVQSDLRKVSQPMASVPPNIKSTTNKFD
jgi:ubiquinone/menaquinone biosynthesis C-methylase UbiE